MVKYRGLYARLAGGWHDHPKLLAVGPLGMAAHAWAISYCADQTTDGFVQTSALPPWAQRQVPLLIEQGLFEAVPGGVALHDYLDHAANRAQILAKRESWREAKRPTNGQVSHAESAEFHA